MILPKLVSSARLGCTFAALALFLAPALARADDAMPLDNSQWISFDHYNEAVAHGKNPLPESSSATPHVDSASLAPVTAATTATDAPPGATNSEVKTDAPQIAAPARPLNLPVMPGLNKQFNIKVTSTVDEKPPTAQIVDIENKPKIHLPSADWQDAASAAKQNEDAGVDEDHAPLNIRYSSLPNAGIAPAPDPTRPSYRERSMEAAKKKPAAADKPEDLAACAAIDAYKKRQLEALQSDRQTLAALQAAIAQMGLQKKLSFMTDATGSVSKADVDGPGVKIDTPVPAPAKN